MDKLQATEWCNAMLVPADTEVVGYENKPDGGVIARLADGSTVEGDVLIGADGIRSKVREQMKGENDKPCFSGYTCYTSVADYQPHNVNTIGYQVLEFSIVLNIGGPFNNIVC